MIITRAPLRVSFAGGGTDQPSFYRKYGPGIVVSTAINRYVYVTLNRKFDGKVSVRYRMHEMTDLTAELRHSLIREILLDYGIRNGVEIVIASEVPANGSGLGASSALAVALCLALERFTGAHENIIPDWHSDSSRRFLAETGARIEIEKCGSPIGKQDHYASALGGVNSFQFNADESVDIQRFSRDEFIDELEGQSMLFYLNLEHEYRGGHFVQKILKEQIGDIDRNARTHILQRDNAAQLRDHMAYAVMERFMDHVNENWRIKKTVHAEISNPEIESFMKRAMRTGASAAKVCGAGGGGFAYLIVQPDLKDEMRREFDGEFPELKFGFNDRGAEIVFEDKRQEAFCED